MGPTASKATVSNKINATSFNLENIEVTAGKWRLTNQPEPVKLLIVLELFTFLGRPGKNWLSELKLWKVTSDKSATFSQYLIYALKLSCRLYSTSTAWETCRWLSCRRLFTPKSFYKQENLQLLIS